MLVSAATAWEIVIGRLQFPIDMLPILPAHHSDPFDCMPIAQSRCESLTLVSDDAAIARYDVALLRAAAT